MHRFSSPKNGIIQGGLEVLQYGFEGATENVQAGLDADEDVRTRSVFSHEEWMVKALAIMKAKAAELF